MKDNIIRHSTEWAIRIICIIIVCIFGFIYNHSSFQDQRYEFSLNQDSTVDIYFNTDKSGILQENIHGEWKNITDRLFFDDSDNVTYTFGLDSGHYRVLFSNTRLQEIHNYSIEDDAVSKVSTNYKEPIQITDDYTGTFIINKPQTHYYFIEMEDDKNTLSFDSGIAQGEVSIKLENDDDLIDQYITLEKGDSYNIHLDNDEYYIISLTSTKNTTGSYTITYK